MGLSRLESGWHRSLRLWLISVPVLTLYMSGLWLALMTPSSFEVGRHLIKGLKNPVHPCESSPAEMLTSVLRCQTMRAFWTWHSRRGRHS